MAGKARETRSRSADGPEGGQAAGGLGATRDEFLQRLRAGGASGAGGGIGTHAGDSSGRDGVAVEWAPRARFVAPRSGVEGFLEAWGALGGTAERAREADLREVVAAHAERFDGPVLAVAGLDVDADLIWPDCGAQAAAGAALGVVRATAAAAQTGTVLLRADVNQGRAASLLPPACVFVIDAATIIDTLGDYLRTATEPTKAGAGAGMGLPSQLVAVTGPSRSADIESTLVIGVHGPGEVHAIITG